MTAELQEKLEKGKILSPSKVKNRSMNSINEINADLNSKLGVFLDVLVSACRLLAAVKGHVSIIQVKSISILLQGFFFQGVGHLSDRFTGPPAFIKLLTSQALMWA